MHIKKINNNRLRFLLTLILFLCGTSVRADELFPDIRAFDPAAIRQSRIQENVRAMIIRGGNGNPSNQNINSSCQVSNPGALNGNPCCRNLVTKECKLAVSRGLCPSGFRYDVDNECNDYCDNPPIPSKSPSASPSKSPSRSPSLAPSLRPGQCLCKPKGAPDSQDNCTIRAGICVRDEGGRQLESCQSTKNICNVPSPTPSAIGPLRCVCKRLGAPDYYRGQPMCQSKLGICNEDNLGQKLESCDKSRRECDQPSPPPSVARSPVSTRSAVVVRSGTPTRTGTPTRSGTPSLTRTPSRSASGTPYPTYTPFPSRTASAPRPTVIASKSTATN